MTLLERAWAFLTDPANRAVLAWLGGGLVVALGGAWTVVTYLRPGSTATRKAGGEPAKVTAAHGSVVVGRDNRGSPITISATPPPSKPPLPPLPPLPPRQGAGAGKSRRRGKRGGKR